MASGWRQVWSSRARRWGGASAPGRQVAAERAEHEAEEPEQQQHKLQHPPPQLPQLPFSWLRTHLAAVSKGELAGRKSGLGFGAQGRGLVAHQQQQQPEPPEQSSSSGASSASSTSTDTSTSTALAGARAPAWPTRPAPRPPQPPQSAAFPAQQRSGRLPLNGMRLERAAGLSGARSRRAEPETADFPSPS